MTSLSPTDTAAKVKRPGKMSKTRQAVATAFGAAVFSFGLAEPAAAQNIEGFLQNIVDILTGGPARLVAICAVAILGITYLAGRISLEKAASVVIGIVVIFGAAEFVNMIAT